MAIGEGGGDATCKRRLRVEQLMRSTARFSASSLLFFFGIQVWHWFSGVSGLIRSKRRCEIRNCILGRFFRSLLQFTGLAAPTRSACGHLRWVCAGNQFRNYCWRQQVRRAWMRNRRRCAFQQPITWVQLSKSTSHKWANHWTPCVLLAEEDEEHGTFHKHEGGGGGSLRCGFKAKTGCAMMIRRQQSTDLHNATCGTTTFFLTSVQN